MRARFLQRPNRSEGPCAYAPPTQSYENKRSLEPTRKLKSTLARFTALGMTIQWGLIFVVLATAQPCAAMIQSSQHAQPPVVMPTPLPTATVIETTAAPSVGIQPAL